MRFSGAGKVDARCRALRPNAENDSDVTRVDKGESNATRVVKVVGKDGDAMWVDKVGDGDGELGVDEGARQDRMNVWWIRGCPVTKKVENIS